MENTTRSVIEFQIEFSTCNSLGELCLWTDSIDAENLEYAKGLVFSLLWHKHKNLKHVEILYKGVKMASRKCTDKLWADHDIMSRETT